MLDEDLADRATFVIDLHRSRSTRRALSSVKLRGGSPLRERRVDALHHGPLLCKDTGKLDAGDPETAHEDLAEQFPCLRLRDERLFELIVGDVPALDEDLANQRRRKGCRVGHSGGVIGRPSFEL